jgi:hypothetical protein
MRCWGSHILLTIGLQMTVSLLRRPHSTPQKYFQIVISVRGWDSSSAIGRPKGLGKFEKINPVTSLEIELTTFRLVANCLNQLHFRLPRICTLHFLSIIPPRFLNMTVPLWALITWRPGLPSTIPQGSRCDRGPSSCVHHTSRCSGYNFASYSKVAGADSRLGGGYSNIFFSVSLHGAEAFLRSRYCVAPRDIPNDCFLCLFVTKLTSTNKLYTAWFLQLTQNCRDTRRSV